MSNRHLWYRTQRFPRSLGEAFKDARYGAAIEIPTRRRSFGWWIAASIAAVLAVAVVVVGGK